MILALLLSFVAATSNVRDVVVNLHAAPYFVTLKLELAGASTQPITLQRKSIGPGLTAASSAQQVFSSDETRGADGFFTVTDSSSSLSPGAVYLYDGASVGGEFIVGAADRRGEVTQALVVVSAAAASGGASAAIDTYVDDLVAEGFAVERINLPASIAPSTLRAQLQAARAASSRPRAFATFIGRVPVVWVGRCCPADGHDYHAGAAETDQYYMAGGGASAWTDSGNWPTGAGDQYHSHNNVPGDGVYDQDVMPAAATIGVGRIDLHDLSLAGAPSEASLLNAYLTKLRNHRRVQTPAMALNVTYNSFQWTGGYYLPPLIRDMFEQMVGASNGVGLSPLINGQQACSLIQRPGLISVMGVGGASHSAMNCPGGDYQSLTNNYRHVHMQLLSSYNFDWSYPTSTLRAVLASVTGLTSMYREADWAPHELMATVHAFKAMLGGMPYGVANAAFLNRHRVQSAQGSTKSSFNLMGDPSLKLLYAPPLGAVGASASGVVTWSAAAAAAVATHTVSRVGYLVYRSAAGGAAPFTLLNDAAPTSATATSYADTTAVVGAAYRYMVRVLNVVHNLNSTVRSFFRDDLSLGATSVLVTITSGGSGAPSFAPTVSYALPPPTPVPSLHDMTSGSSTDDYTPSLALPIALCALALIACVVVVGLAVWWRRSSSRRAHSSASYGVRARAPSVARRVSSSVTRSHRSRQNTTTSSHGRASGVFYNALMPSPGGARVPSTVFGVGNASGDETPMTRRPLPPRPAPPTGMAPTRRPPPTPPTRPRW